MHIVERARQLLLTPKAEWEAISRETRTVQGLFTGYAMVLAAIPAVSNFIGYSVVGVSGVRLPMSYGVTQLVIGYAISLAAVYLLAIVIDALGPTFGAERNFMQALKVSVFMPTAGWLAGLFNLVPWLSILTLAGGLYSLYLLFVGLPLLMRAPESQAVPYTVVVMLITIVLAVAIGLLQFLFSPPLMRGF